VAKSPRIQLLSEKFVLTPVRGLQCFGMYVVLSRTQRAEIWYLLRLVLNCIYITE
jgi:hypothetical protein